MKELTTRFIYAKKEFINSNGSESSVENLYDIVYLLRDIKDRNSEQNYILAEIYNLVGKNIFASKIINNSLINAKGKEIERLKSIQKRIDNQRNNWNVKKYRDLRDAKIIKDSTKLNIEDFIIFKERDNTYTIKISEKIKNIVILNKKMPNENEYGYLYSEKEPNTYYLQNDFAFRLEIGNKTLKSIKYDPEI